jgi:hypothetical protein
MTTKIRADSVNGLNRKQRAFQFLKSLEDALETLPPPTEMDRWVRSQCTQAKGNDELRHLRNPEAAFLNGQVIPLVHRLISTYEEMDTDRATHALLNEYYRCMPTMSRNTPARLVRHPFTKVLSGSGTSIYSRWANDSGKFALVQSCPDFALQSPFPHKIVFEGKYFSRGSLKFARQELAVNIYQAFFYRGLPPVPDNGKGRAWDYEYACLLAYDASPDSTLKRAWHEIPAAVRNGFWDGANIYVMVLGADVAK